MEQRKGDGTMTPEEMRENLREMRDFTFIASTGATVHVDCSLLRSMTPQERNARRERFNQLAQRIRMKYATRVAGGAQ